MTRIESIEVENSGRQSRPGTRVAAVVGAESSTGAVRSLSASKKRQNQASSQPGPGDDAKPFAESRNGTGTKEWSDASYNICRGCEHQCRYCYAWTDISRFNKGFRDAEDWAKQKLRTNTALGADAGNRGVVMFPTSHDITPAFLPQSLETIKNLIANGNEVLVVTKPHRDVIAALCDGLREHEDRILFRFTIGSLAEATCAFWEPGASPPTERLAALRHAFEAGFQTSVSVEPMLEDLDGTRAVVEAVEPFVTDTIWLGKMNRMPRKRNAHVPGFGEAAEKIDAHRKDNRILALVDAFAGHPKIRWKDSVKKVLEKHGRRHA